MEAGDRANLAGSFGNTSKALSTSPIVHLMRPFCLAVMILDVYNKRTTRSFSDHWVAHVFTKYGKFVVPIVVRHFRPMRLKLLEGPQTLRKSGAPGESQTPDLVVRKSQMPYRQLLTGMTALESAPQLGYVGLQNQLTPSQ